MPYISMERRDRVAPRTAETAGDLNYGITRLLIGYLQEHGLSYQTLNDIVGALEGAKAEFQRRVVAPYEDQKIRRNGDVYPVQVVSDQSNQVEL